MERWPALRYDDWKDTLHTLHLWTQIVGKIRLEREAFVNHWWHVTLYVTPRGLTTSSMPYPDGRSFTIAFDFLSHELRIDGCDGEHAIVPLVPMSVADFYERLMAELHALGFDVAISAKPNEVVDAIPFAKDTTHASYDARAAERFHRVLLQADRLFKEFRSEFVGKASPSHFWWGSFDLATTRFSGRPAPPHPGGFPNMPDAATREAYSHEEHSVGFWPGGPGMEAFFYAYAYPEPPGFPEAAVAPPAARWNGTMREFVLAYEDVRTAADPDAAVLAFCRSTYAAAADLAHWDRAALERGYITSMDLTKQAPRSAKDKLDGLVSLKRTIDKAKAYNEGKLGEYDYDCPHDRPLFEFIGTDGPTFAANVKALQTDEAIGAWVNSLIAGKSQAEIAAFNADRMHWHPEPGTPSADYFAKLRDRVAPGRTDVTTWFDLLDLDEGRTVPEATPAG